MVASQSFYDEVLHWWVLCSLNEQCFTPVWSSWEACTNDKQHCHCNATSILNVLVANKYDFDPKKYTLDGVGDFFIPGNKTYDGSKLIPRQCRPTDINSQDQNPEMEDGDIDE